MNAKVNEILNILLNHSEISPLKFRVMINKLNDNDIFELNKITIDHRSNTISILEFCILFKKNWATHSLLQLQAMKESASQNNNRALSWALFYRQSDLAMELLKINTVRMAADTDENYALCMAVRNGDLEIVRELLKIDAVKAGAAEKENFILCLAIRNGDFEIVQALLKLDTVAAAAAIDENDALSIAAENGYLEIVQELLKINEVKAAAAVDENNALNMAVENNHFEIVKELLKIDVVKAAAAINKNYALKIAIENGYFEIAKELLKIGAVKKAVTAKNNATIHGAAEKFRFDMVQLLLTIPEVFDCLLRNNAQGLIKLYRSSDESTRSFILSRPIYGICLDQIVDKKSETLIEDIQSYCIDPQGYLERTADYSLNQIQAVRLLKSHLDVTNYEHMQEEARLAMLQRLNPDDEGKIAVITNHFEKVIKPAFKDEFVATGAADIARLLYIESKIRALLLNRIVKDLQAQLQNKDNADEIKRRVSCIEFIDTHFDTLKLGQDENLMAQARDYFCSNNDNNHVAWRAYDKWAPCVKQWPNLLTPPVEEGHKRVFTVDVLGEHDTTAASLMVRELVAYSFLLVNDENDGDEATKLNRIENFIGQIKDIRRAHNLDNDKGMDNPSCFPGSVGRVGTMWSMHSFALTKKMLELLPEIFRAIIARKFSAALADCDTQEQKDDLYHSLIMLRKENAQEVINKQVEFCENPAWARKRQEFIDNMGSLKEIEQEVNLVLKKMRSEDRLTPGQYVYLFEYLADIGGGWSAEILTHIYRQHVSEMEIETIPIQAAISNPFAINAMMRKWLPAENLQMQEQSLLAWEIVFPILVKNFSASEKCEELAKMIARDWAKSKKNGLMTLELSTFTLAELDSAITDPQQQHAMNAILQEYKSGLKADQINEVGKAQPSELQMEDDNKLHCENTLIFNNVTLGKRARTPEDNKSEEWMLLFKRIKKNNN